MGELLSSSSILISNGLCCRPQSHNPNRDYGICSRHDFFYRYLCLGSSTERKRFGRLALNLTSIFKNGFNCLSTQQWRKWQMNQFYGSSRLDKQIMVANVESELVCEEEEEEKSVMLGGKEDFDNDSNECELPPWGNVGVNNDSAFGCGDASQPLTVPKEMAHVYGTGIHFLEERDEVVLSKRLLTLSRCNKVRSALELIRSMELSGLRPNMHACNAFLTCLLRKSQINDALKVFEFMELNEITTGHTYSLILKAIADTQGCKAAVEMFLKLESQRKVRKKFDAVVYNTMISVCGRENSWILTERVWRRMKENDKTGTSITYRLLVCIFSRCSRSDLAVDAYAEMIHGGLKPTEDAMQAVIGACAKEGKCELALSVFFSMLNDGLKPTLIACNAMINLLGKDGKVELAFKVYSLTKTLGHAPDSYTWFALIGALYRANRHADALQLFDRIKREEGNQLSLHLYNIALMCCRGLGLWERAVQLLWQMEASDLSVSTASYNLVIGACEIARKPKVALQVYDRMVDQKCMPDTFTYLSLMRSCIWGSLWPEVEEILKVAPNASLYNAAIHGMCLRREAESAKELYMRMLKIGLKPDGKTQVMMLQKLARDSYGERTRYSSRRRKLTKRRS